MLSTPSRPMFSKTARSLRLPLAAPHCGKGSEMDKVRIWLSERLLTLSFAIAPKSYRTARLLIIDAGMMAVDKFLKEEFDNNERPPKS